MASCCTSTSYGGGLAALHACIRVACEIVALNFVSSYFAATDVCGLSRLIFLHLLHPLMKHFGPFKSFCI